MKLQFNGFPRGWRFGFVLLILLLLRFLFEWQLASKFQPGQGVKLNFCLSNQPYYGQEKQTLYYQNHFQRIRISLPAEPRLDFGDCLQVKGKIEECPDEERTKFCLTDSQTSPFKEELRFKLLTSSLLKRLRAFREKLSEMFLRNLPYPESDLISGIVLGVKQSLDPQFYQELRLTGTLHIIVASGYNLSVTGEKPVSILAYFIGRKLAIISGFILVWLYVGLVGFEPPVVRAGVMLSFLFLAQLVGKKYDQWRVLIFSGWLMLILDPDLLTSISFQLSLTALLGIMLGRKLFSGLNKIPLIGKDLAETLSAQLMVTPIIAWHFGRLSWLAPITNALILPLIPWVMALGILGLLFGWIPFLGQLAILISYPLLWWSISVIGLFSRLPQAELPLKINWWQMVLTYLVILFVLRKKNEEK